MQLNGLLEATKFVTDQLEERDYEIISGVWINEKRNALYTTVNKLGYDETFYLKYDSKPYYLAGNEVQLADNEKIGVCINKDIYENYIIPSQANILYALPDAVYHMNYVIFAGMAIDHVQRFNNEPVMIVPFSKLTLWAR